MSRQIPVVWTNDDVTLGGAAILEEQLAFLDRLNIPGVFFLIPRSTSGDLDQDRELLRVIEKARNRGHEFQLHGLVHDAYECGVPELAMLDFDGPTRERFDSEREAIEAMHTMEALTAMLETGREIWRRAFGDYPTGFRPGWGAYCGNLYRALSSLGFQWVSSRIPCMTSWIRNSGRWEFPICFRDKIPTQPHRTTHGVWEFPMAGDYAFRVPADGSRMSNMTELCLAEFDEYYTRNHPMLLVSHFHGLMYLQGQAPEPLPAGTGYRVHERILPALRDSGRARFVGMNTLVSEYL